MTQSATDSDLQEEKPAMATGNAPAVRITVVIPTYNRAAVIGEALETVFAQTYPVHEIIVVDDASSDATCDIVRGFDDPRIKLIARQENGGGDRKSTRLNSSH